MTAIIIGERNVLAENPTFTADRRNAAFLKRANETWEERAYNREKAKRDGMPDPEASKELYIPGLSKADLQRKYGAAAPRCQTGTVQVPINITTRQWDRLKIDKIKKWLDAMAMQGWQLCRDMQFPQGATVTLEDGRKIPIEYEGGGTIIIYPGVYPSLDLRDHFPRFDRRDFIFAAYFRFENPKPRRIELDASLFQPFRVGGGTGNVRLGERHMRRRPRGTRTMR